MQAIAEQATDNRIAIETEFQFPLGIDVAEAGPRPLVGADKGKRIGQPFKTLAESIVKRGNAALTLREPRRYAPTFHPQGKPSRSTQRGETK